MRQMFSPNALETVDPIPENTEPVGASEVDRICEIRGVYCHPYVGFLLILCNGDPRFKGSSVLVSNQFCSGGT